MKTQNAQPDTQRAIGAREWRRAFTLMELMVAIALLVVIMLAVGLTFSGTSRSVGMSQATMESMAEVRALQQLIERDVKAMDRNGFLVISSCVANPAQLERSYRFDQLSFLVNANLSNRSGAQSGSPFTDSSQAGAAHVWWGQGVMEKTPGSPGWDNSYLPPGQGVATPRNRPPTGALPGPGGTYTVREEAFTLLRHLTLLFPGPAVNGVIQPAGNPVVAYSGLEHGTASVGTSEGGAHISSSRYGAAAVTPAQVMQTIVSEREGGASPLTNLRSGNPEYEFYTYRFRALDSIYDTEVTNNPFVNGYFRTVPIVMRGTSSFRVEWTDGSIWPTGSVDSNNRPIEGQLKWYGPSFPSGANNSTNNPTVEPYWGGMGGAANPYGDQYVAVFSYHNKALWPKALRISVHVANERLGGRDFVQVVDLPQ